jgi:hypothetical protein
MGIQGLEAHDCSDDLHPPSWKSSNVEVLPSHLELAGKNAIDRSVLPGRIAGLQSE